MSLRTLAVIWILAFAASGSGCTIGEKLAKPWTQECKTVAYLEPPAADLQDTPVPARKTIRVNEDWVTYTGDLREALGQCNASKAETRAWIEKHRPKD